MTNWRAVQEQDYAVPTGMEMSVLLDELGELLASPDPVERDEWGYGILATWLARGVIDEPRRIALGDEMAGRFDADEIWTRAFAPLILDCLVTYGTFEARWVDPFAQWYATESDLRGFDTDLGWLHAVAHGADLLGTFGRHVEVSPRDMLDLAARRLAAPTDLLWGAGEDERLGHAISLTLTHPALSEADAVRWIDEVSGSWEGREPGPPAAQMSNAARTMRVVLTMTLTGARSDGYPTRPMPHAGPVRVALVSALHTLTPHMW